MKALLFIVSHPADNLNNLELYKNFPIQNWRKQSSKTHHF